MGGLYTQLPKEIEEVDVIIAGGGTAGCIVAARLSDADPSLSILVIEGGQNNFQVPSVIHPVLFFEHLLPQNKTAVFYQANKEEAIAGREIVVPAGGVLGGGSSINILMYSRAQRHDFDSWNTPGWSADEMLPYLKKLETYHGPGARDTHGSDGPIHISGGPYRAVRPQSDFIEAAAKVGWPEYSDLQDLDTNDGVQRAQRFISPDGVRQDSAHKYLHPKLRDGNHPNLRVLVEHRVVRVLFDEEGKKKKRASGVEFRPNPEFQNSTDVSSRRRVVKARKMVIVSCGALGTPTVLERSGIGSPEILEKAGVSVVADVPGVGSNYQDHQLLSYGYKTSLNPDETVDALITGRLSTAELIANNSRFLGWNAQDITAKLRPTDADVAALGPDFQAAWDEDYKNHPDKPLVLMSPVSGYNGPVPPGQYLMLTVFTVYPYSRGSIHITGARPSGDDDDDDDNDDDAASFTTGFFSDARGLDVKKHMWAYKKQREMVRRMRTYRGEIAGSHPPFAAGSEAAPAPVEGRLDAPLPDGVSDIRYTPEDDVVLERWLREHVSTTWHSLGTCKMAPLEAGGVVGADLAVYGVRGLKVADLSIPPENVGANTANTAMAIGEKAADIFIRELCLEKGRSLTG